MIFGDMIVNTPRDLLVFFSVFVCGVCIGAVFDVFRALRKAYPPSFRILSFQDAVFCAFAFFMFSHTVSTYADGDLRWYVFAGLFFGISLYFFTIGKYVFNFFLKIFMTIKKTSDYVFCYVKKFFKKIFTILKK